MMGEISTKKSFQLIYNNNHLNFHETVPLKKIKNIPRRIHTNTIHGMQYLNLWLLEEEQKKCLGLKIWANGWIKKSQATFFFNRFNRTQVRYDVEAKQTKDSLSLISLSSQLYFVRQSVKV